MVANLKLVWRLDRYRANVWGCQHILLQFICSSDHGTSLACVISDAHEWINEIPTVPIYYLAKPQPRERGWKNQRGKKTLLSLTLV